MSKYLKIGMKDKTLGEKYTSEFKTSDTWLNIYPHNLLKKLSLSRKINFYCLNEPPCQAAGYQNLRKQSYMSLRGVLRQDRLSDEAI
jgi:hypothetical protein